MGKELTFIIPSYNMELYLPKCLESFGIDQLQKEDGALADALEVIVVNDGSTDRTSELAHQFAGRFPKVVKVIDKANGHYGSCVNVALRNATGRYVRILDADDYLETDEVAKYLRFVISLNGAADLVVNDYDEVGASGAVSKVVRYGLPSDTVFPMGRLVDSNELLDIHGIAYRKEVLTKMDYRQSEGIMYTDAEWYSLPMSHVATIAYRPGVLTHYLVGREGQSMERDRFVGNIGVLAQIVKRLVQDFDGCQATGQADGCRYARKRILALVQLIYTMVLFGYMGIRAKFDLWGFDAWLKNASRAFYDEMENSIVISRCPFHYVTEWRRRHSDRTWRFRLARLALNMRTFLAAKWAGALLLVFSGCVQMELSSAADGDENSKMQVCDVTSAYGWDWGESAQAMFDNRIQKADGRVDERSVQRLVISQTWWEVLATWGSLGIAKPVELTIWLEEAK